ncbi:MAC/perforin domain-containing protein [Aquimarina algiphila]|uniref:MAC/perforin domain-containing protein n=1 Tax=Aquimarina algiphila TaxID=2047982 RepID=UPI00232F1CE6|nr:MAC/perforin domain-containing protein [Aquimarina algiphila]
MSTLTKTNFEEAVNLSASKGEIMPYLSQSNGVGQGFDVFGAANANSFIRPLLDPAKVQKRVFSLLGKNFLVPDYINPIEKSSAYFEGGTYMTRSEFQNSIAANAKVEIGYGLFSGEMEAAYSNEKESSSEYAFTYNNSFIGVASLQLGEFENALRNSFLERVAKLPGDVSEQNLSDFISFFNDYGIYATNQIELGGAMKYYVSVEKSSELGEEEIEAMMKAQYNGLFVSGSISADIKKKDTWKKYSKSTNYTISVVGGDPSLAIKLAAVDPLEPSKETVELYSKWSDSVSSYPAMMDFKLTGIWTLCGDKKNVVERAWTLFSEQIHPAITLETTSTITRWPISVSPKTPIIALNGNPIKPKIAATTPVGYQLCILSNNGFLPKVLDNKYFCLDDSKQLWSPISYRNLYSELSEYVTNSKFNKKDNILLLISFGMGQSVFPTQNFYEVLKLNGAGEELNNWSNHSGHGSDSSPSYIWMNRPINYVLVSLMGYGPNIGNEVYMNKITFNGEVNTQKIFYLFKNSITGTYTVGS